MSQQDREPLPLELRDLLDAERKRDPLAPEISARLHGRLSALLPAAPLPSPNAAPAGTSAAGAKIGAASAGTLAGAKLLPIALAFVLGGAAGSAITVQLVQTRPDAAPAAKRVPDAVAAVPVQVPPAQQPAAIEPQSEAASRGPAIEPQVAREPSTQAADADAQRVQSSADHDLAVERNLIELARTALSTARPNDAMLALERHARRFPRGRLAEERDGLRVLTLVRLDRYEDAKRTAARFHQQHPSSLFAPMVDQALSSIP